MSNSSILDVLTNGIGSLLLLMLIFVRMMGEPPALSERQPKASKPTCSAPLLILSADTAQLARPLRWILRVGDANHRPVQFNPVKESSSQIRQRMIDAGVIQTRDPFLMSYDETGVVKLAFSVRDGATVDLEAFPLDGPSTPDAKMYAKVMVTGAKLRPANMDVAGSVFELRADWLDDVVAGSTGVPSYKTVNELPLASAAAGQSANLRLSVSLAGRKLKECN